MFPLWDENPTRRRPLVTIALILACLAVFFFVQPQGSTQGDIAFTYERAAIPCEIVNGRPLTEAETVDTVSGDDRTACDGDSAAGPAVFPDKNVWASILTSMFLHGSLFHVGGNMLFLWVFGNNVEDHLGPVRYLAFYLLAGVIATIAHLVSALDSTVPLLGASGAVAGVMGAYLVWFPLARVRTLVAIFPIRLPALVPLVVWFASQFLIDPGAGIAWRAHVGGFLVGVAMAVVVRRSMVSAARGHQATTPRLPERGRPRWDNRRGGIVGQRW